MDARARRPPKRDACWRATHRLALFDGGFSVREHRLRAVWGERRLLERRSPHLRLPPGFGLALRPPPLQRCCCAETASPQSFSARTVSCAERLRSSTGSSRPSSRFGLLHLRHAPGLAGRSALLAAESLSTRFQGTRGLANNPPDSARTQKVFLQTATRSGTSIGTVWALYRHGSTATRAFKTAELGAGN